MATSAKKASRFIARLIDNGYNDTGLAVLLPVLLRDLEMNDASPDDIMILLTTDVFTFLRTVSDKIGINRAISICDELCAPTKVNILLWCDVILPAISDNQIINHNINQSYTTLLRVYGQGYRVISNNVSQYRIDSLEYQKSGKYVYTVNNAFDNGLYVPSIVMYESMAKSEMDGCMTLGKPIVVPKHLTEIHKTSLSDSDEQKLVKMISPFLLKSFET